MQCVECCVNPQKCLGVHIFLSKLVELPKVNAKSSGPSFFLTKMTGDAHVLADGSITFLSSMSSRSL